MKPLPEAVQAAFPCHPSRVPERPWWVYRWVENDHVRADAERVVGGSLVDFDAEHPLPHPGFRAGQVWAAENGESIVVVAILLGQVCIAHDEDGWYPSTFARAYPYLMADPACPWLAPWSPAEDKKP